jgi:hypothetical protein
LVVVAAITSWELQLRAVREEGEEVTSGPLVQALPDKATAGDKVGQAVGAGPEGVLVRPVQQWRAVGWLGSAESFRNLRLRVVIRQVGSQAVVPGEVALQSMVEVRLVG